MFREPGFELLRTFVKLERRYGQKYASFFKLSTPNYCPIASVLKIFVPSVRVVPDVTFFGYRSK